MALRGFLSRNEEEGHLEEVAPATSVPAPDTDGEEAESEPAQS